MKSVKNLIWKNYTLVKKLFYIFQRKIISNKLKLEFTNVAQELIDLGFEFIATKGTAAHLRKKGIKSKVIWRISDKKQPDILSVMRRGNVDLIINLPTGRRAATDGAQMRRLAVELGIPFITTLTGAKAAIDSLKEGEKDYLKPLKKIRDWNMYKVIFYIGAN